MFLCWLLPQLETVGKVAGYRLCIWLCKWSWPLWLSRPFPITSLSYFSLLSGFVFIFFSFLSSSLFSSPPIIILIIYSVSPWMCPTCTPTPHIIYSWFPWLIAPMVSGVLTKWFFQKNFNLQKQQQKKKLTWFVRVEGSKKERKERKTASEKEWMNEYVKVSLLIIMNWTTLIGLLDYFIQIIFRHFFSFPLSSLHYYFFHFLLKNIYISLNLFA